jgi:TolA-binding protein
VLPRLITAIRGTDSAAAVPPTASTLAAHPAEVATPPEPPPSAPPLVEATEAAGPATAAWAPPPVTARATWTTSAARGALPQPVESRNELPPASADLPVLVASPADVFASATRARLDGDRPLAVARYRQLLAGWPASLEAAQTRASLGRLLLDDGAPSAALELLDGYLRGPDGTLREEVLASRAQALARLGRAADETRAWQSLLEEYPESIHAVRARARLGSMVAASP